MKTSLVPAEAASAAPSAPEAAAEPPEWDKWSEPPTEDIISYICLPPIGWLSPMKMQDVERQRFANELYSLESIIT